MRRFITTDIRKWIRLDVIICLTVATLMLAGCVPVAIEEPATEPAQTAVMQIPTSAPQDKQEEPVAEPAPKAVDQRLTLGLGRNLYEGTASWHFLHGSLGVWEPLVILDNDMLPVPVLATSWESNPEGTEWTFFLRQGVNFHDGTPFDAEAVLINVPALQDEYSRTVPQLAEIVKVDDYTVRFLLTEPSPNLPHLIAYFSSAMLSPSCLGEDGRPASPIGTGPFKFVNYVKDDSIILERNEDYWGVVPQLEEVVFKFIPDATTRLTALRTGEIDAIADVGALQPEQASIIKENPDLVLKEVGVATTHYLTFNSGAAPFDDPRLRQAVSMSIDRQYLVDTTLFGYGLPGVSVITPFARQWVNPDATPGYDSEEAQRLAGEVLGGSRVQARLLLSSGLIGRWPYVNISQILQANLAELGIDVEIVTMEAGAWNEALKNGEYHMTMMPYTLMTGDPDFFMSPWVWSKGSLNTRRSYGYSDPRADELILTAISEMDPSKRKAMYDELQLIVAEDVPFTPLYHEMTIYAFRKEVQGLELDIQFKPSLEWAYIQGQE